MNVYFSLFLYIVSFISLAIAVHAWRLAGAQGARWLSMLMACLAWWAGIYGFELAAPSLGAKLFWAKAEYVGIVLAPVAWLAFALSYTGYNRRLKLQWRRLIGALFVVPLLTLLAVWTNEAHGLVWSSVRLQQVDELVVLTVTYGPLFGFHSFYSYMLLIVGTLILFRGLWRYLAFPFYRKHGVVIAIGIFTPWVANALYLLKVLPVPGLDLTPFAFTVTGLVLMWGVSRLQFLDVVPLARDVIVEQMGDGILVLDVRLHVVDANHQAATLMRVDLKTLVGQRLDDLSPELANFVATAPPLAGCRGEVLLGQNQVLEVKYTPLLDRATQTVVGRLLVLQDITARKRLERRLAAQTEILAHIAADAPLHRILEETVKAIEALVPGAIGAILLVDENEEQLHHVAAPHLPAQYVRAIDGIPIAPDAGSCGAAAWRRELVIVADIASNSLWRRYRKAALAHGLRACWSVPILDADGHVLGTFATYYRKPRAPAQDELEVVERAGFLVSLAVERERNRQTVRRREAVLQAVAFAAETLLRTGEWEEGIRHVLAHLGQAIEAERASLFTVSAESDGQTIARCLHVWTAPGVQPPGDSWNRFGLEEHGLKHWADELQRGTSFRVHIRDVSGAEQAFLHQHRIVSAILVPVLIDETWWGFLAFDTGTRSQRWSAAEADALKSAATLIGAAVQRQRLDEERQRRVREAQFLNEITRVALEAQSLEEVACTVIGHMRAFFGADNCYITLWDEERQRPVPLAANGRVDTAFYRCVPDTLRLEKDTPTLTASVLQVGHALVVDDVFNSPYLDPRIAACFPDRQVLAVPLFAGTHRLGAIIVGFERPRPIPQHQVKIAEQVGAQMALAIAKVQALETARRRAEETETLRQAGTIVASTLDFEEAINRILAQLARVVPHDSASVQLLRQEQDDTLYLEIVGGWGWEDPSQVLGIRFPIPADNPNTRVVLKRTPVLLHDAPQAYAAFRESPHSHIRSWLGVPLIARGEVIGMLAIDSTMPGHFTQEHVRLVTAFADQVAIAIENARLYKSVQEQVRELERIYTAAQELAESPEPRAILPKLARHFVEIVEATACVIREIEWNKQTATIVATYHRAGEKAGDFQGIISLDKCPAALKTAVNRVLGEYHVDDPALGEQMRSVLKQHGVHHVLYVPLVSRGAVYGVAEIWQTSERRSFVESEKRLVETLAQHAASVLENAHLYAAERRARYVAETLRHVNVMLSQHLELDAVLQVLLNHVTRLIPCDAVNVLLREEPDRMRLHMLHGYEQWTDASQLRGHTLLLTEHPHLQRILEEGCSLIIADTSHYEGWVPDDPPGTTFVRSWLGVPLTVMGETIGVLSLDKAEPHFFTEEHRHIAEALAIQAAIAIQNARLFARTQQHASQLRALYRAAQTLLSTLDLDKLLQRVLEAAIEAVPTAEKGTLLLVDRETGVAAIRALYGYADPRVFTLRFVSTGGYSAKAIREKRPLLIVDAHVDPDILYTGDIEEVREIRSAIVVPLMLHGEVLGAISLDSTRRAAFTPEDLELLETFAITATAAIRNAQRHEEVRWLAIVDPLTEVYNRRGLFEFGYREVERARRFGRPLAAVMFDLDHFKHVNDTYGHAVGDQVLVGLAKRVQTALRSTDLLGRYGGEEFVVLLPETSQEKAYAIAERIRKIVYSAPFETDMGPIEITISLGIAMLDETCTNLESLIARADEALYQAKQAGRDTTVIWDSEKYCSVDP